MRRCRCISGGSAVALVMVLAATWPLAAPPGDKEKERGDLPHPGPYLREALKNVAKLESVAVSLSIEGGISEDKDHQIKSMTVRQSYSGAVFKNKLMHLPTMRVFRTPESGVRFTGGQWKSVLADETGVLMDRLFDFPLDVLGKAYKHARKAEWVGSPIAEEEPVSVAPPVIDIDEIFGPSEGDETAGDDADGAGRGKTVVAGDAETEKKAPRLPSVIRVEAPPKEALEHFLSVEKSGCIGGG